MQGLKCMISCLGVNVFPSCFLRHEETCLYFIDKFYCLGKIFFINCLLFLEPHDMEKYKIEIALFAFHEKDQK
jgi:hypothetical protein